MTTPQFPNASSCGPGYITFDGKWNMPLGVNQLSLEALRAGLFSIKGRLMDQIGLDAIGESGVAGTPLAKLLTMAFTVFDGERSPPGMGDAPFVYGRYVFLPAARVDAALEAGPQALEDLLMEGIAIAQTQSETQDNLDAVPFVDAAVQQQIRLMAQDAPGQRAWRLNMAQGKGGASADPSFPLTHPEDFWALLAGGCARDLWERVLEGSEVQDPVRALEFLRAVGSAEPSAGWMIWHAALRTQPVELREISRGKLIELAKMASTTPTITSSEIKQIVDVISGYISVYRKDPPQFGFTQPDHGFSIAQSLWRQAKDEPTNDAQACVDLLHFLENDIQKGKGFQPDPKDLQQAWEQTRQWIVQLPDHQRSNDVIAAADLICPGLAGPELMAQERFAFLNQLLKGGEQHVTTAFAQPHPETVRQATAHLWEVFHDHQADTSFSSYFTLAVQRGGMALNVMSQAMDAFEPRLDEYQRKRLDTTTPSTNDMEKLRKGLVETSQRQPLPDTIVARADNWWRQRAGSNLSDPAFIQKWSKWIEGSSEDLMRQHLRSMSSWQREQLGVLARATQAKATQTEPDPEVRARPRLM